MSHKETEKYVFSEKKHVVAEKPVVAPKKESANFLSYIQTGQLRDAEIAAFHDAEDPYFEVVENGEMYTKVMVSQDSFDAIKRARPVIDIKRA